MDIKFGEIIKAKREEKGYSLMDFAKVVGISAGYLSQLENGHKENPKLEIVLKIIKVLEIDIDMLLGLDASKESISMPPLLKLIVAKDRNCKALEDKEVLKKVCNIIDKSLECKYLIENKALYEMFLEDIYIQIETTLKRYMAFQIIKDSV